MTATAPLAVDARLSALETRVEGIAGSLTSVVTAVNSLGEKLDRRSTTPWAVIWSALGVMLTFVVAVGGLAYWPIKDGQSDMKAALLTLQDRADKRIEALTATQVTRAEHEVHWRMGERLYDFQRDRISRVENRIEKRLERLEAERFKPGG